MEKVIQVMEKGHGVVDAVVGASILAALVGWLPPVAAFLGIVYTSARLIIEWPKLKARLKEICTWQ